MAQHATLRDYQTSRSWRAVAATISCERLMRLRPKETRHGLAIAEYDVPRSQMMRYLDHFNMHKNGSGWSAMTGVAPAKIAHNVFTCPRAVTVEAADTYWTNLAARYNMNEKYLKPNPVCNGRRPLLKGRAV